MPTLRVRVVLMYCEAVGSPEGGWGGWADDMASWTFRRSDYSGLVPCPYLGSGPGMPDNYYCLQEPSFRAANLGYRPTHKRPRASGPCDLPPLALPLIAN